MLRGGGRLKDDDKLIESMFDEIIETSVKPDGEIEVKLVSPSPEEVEHAVADFRRSWREFYFLDPMRYGDIGWWDALQHLALADSRLKEIFCGRDRSPASLRQWHRWRLHIADNRPYITNA
jgi:hypothetical protein